MPEGRDGCIIALRLHISPAHQSCTLLPSGEQYLVGRPVDRDPLQSSEGWQKFTGGWLVGGLSGVAWGYILTQILPYCEYLANLSHDSKRICTRVACSARGCIMAVPSIQWQE